MSDFIFQLDFLYISLSDVPDFEPNITCRVSAARLRSRTPSEDWPRSSTNFFVNKPSEVSYRVFSGGDLGAVEERKGEQRANVNAR